jgi:penicillin-binding protein 1A
VAIDHGTGRVLALVGGRDFATHQFDLATQGRRQPGSAFKPFVLARALEEGVSPDQAFDASPYSVKIKDGTWTVRNYENQFAAGKMTLRAATNWSVNCVYARLIMQVGPEDVVGTAKKMGITSPLEPNPAIALGGLSQGVSPLEMASAYGTFANSGIHIEPFLIKQVKRGREVLFTQQQRETQVLKPAVNAAALRMLEGPPSAGGTAPIADLPSWPVAGKTGTTQLATDAWFVGTTPVLSTAVWVGHKDSQVSMYGATGGGTAAPVWRQFMDGALANRQPKDFPSVDEAEFVGKTVNVPNVVGLSEQAALSKLAKKKLIGRAQLQASPSPAGSVLWVSPSDSAQVGTTVYVGVSTGVPPPPPEPESDDDDEPQRRNRNRGNGGNGGGGNGGGGGGRNND